MASLPLPLASRRILVVDDQPSIRGVLRMVLSEAGADVWEADDGDAALRILESSLPEVILLDLIMPRMDGWQVIQALSSSARTVLIPVVLQTSAHDFASFDSAKQRGVAAFLSKPFRLKEVVETCRRVLEGARPLQGTGPRPDATRPAAQVRDPGGSLIAVGFVVETDDSGAQLDLETALNLGQVVHLTYRTEDGTVTREGEVRWITKAEPRYLHGLALRQESG